MVDRLIGKLSPKYKEILARKFDMLGGVHYMPLTHKDDVGEHDKWAQRLKDYRIADAERNLNGDGPWTIGSDFELVYSPGHTEGSVCLYYKQMKIIFVGDHLDRSGETGEFLDISLIYNQQSVRLQLYGVKKLSDLDFNWIFPGHGRRIGFKDNHEKNIAVKDFLASNEHLHDNSNTRHKEPLFA
ncbi:hypothetical protein LUZ63_009182 [Rhynchospora breviuscula]|uniref:Metallo-beta-lactamase domain-containing protein n=1 Tax=Rhynchospora breviuscula TaxID=2022672 RepID=A0A9Q0CEK0_9POAL|nr:hypothetical protein LUZ63_009182 [Rhynchospora breviuscula]